VEFCAKRFNFKLATDQEMDGFAALLFAEMGRSTQCKSAGQVSIEAGAGYYAMIKTAQSFKDVLDKRSVLRALNQPVLIMRGQCDGIPWGYVAEYLELFKHSESKIIKDAGHSIVTTAPELYQETILVFLNK
jgi:proline iminopeptidase